MLAYDHPLLGLFWSTFQAYVQQAAGSGGVASELSKLADLRASGALTDAEFEARKATLLAT